MKLKVTAAALLLLCFAWLAILSGAVPVLAGGEEHSPDASHETIISEPETPSAPTDTPDPADTAPLDPIADAAEATSPTPIPTAAPSDVSVISTTITSDSPLDNDTSYDIDTQALLDAGSTLSLPSEGYQILIIHTHATEAYTPDGTDVYEQSDEYRTTDMDHSVVRVGEELAKALSAYGLNVLHDCALYDYPSYNGSYVRCGVAVEEYLAAYPGISMVIDLHRDALGSGDTIYKTVTEAEGTQAAQIMFVMGSDENLEHPRWQENLTLALTLQEAVQARYDSLMRPVVLCSYRYNQQLSPGYLLMEVGTAGNTLQEAITAVQLFADAVGPLLVARVEQE